MATDSTSRKMAQAYGNAEMSWKFHAHQIRVQIVREGLDHAGSMVARVRQRLRFRLRLRSKGKGKGKDRAHQALGRKPVGGASGPRGATEVPVRGVFVWFCRGGSEAREVVINGSGWSARWVTSAPTAREATTRCSSGTCETMRVCSTAPIFGDVGGCDCSTPGRAGGGVSFGVLVLLGFLALQARRRP